MSGFGLISRRNQLCLKSPFLAPDIWSPSLGVLWAYTSGSIVYRCPGGGAVNHSAKWAEISALRSVQKVQDVVAREDTAGSGSSG